VSGPTSVYPQTLVVSIGISRNGHAAFT